MKYLLVPGVCALAAPVLSGRNGDLIFAPRELPSIQARSHSHSYPEQARTSSSLQQLFLHSRSPLNDYPSTKNLLQKRTARPLPAGRSSSQKLGRTTSSVRFPSPERSPSQTSLSQSTPKAPTLRPSRSLKSQSSLVSLTFSPSRDSSPWRRQRDTIDPSSRRNSLDRVRTSRSPIRDPRSQGTSRGGSPWRDGGGAVHGYDTGPVSAHSILGFGPDDAPPSPKEWKPPLRVPSQASIDEKTDVSPMGPITPVRKIPVRGQSTPVTPSTPLRKWSEI